MTLYFSEQILPLVTVIIPSYNYGRFIEEAIDSVLASDYPQELIEIIVIDDGSTDNTGNVVKAYGNRVNYQYIDNTRKAGAIKLGVEQAQGKYIFNLDADDLFESEKIRKVVDIFESDDEIVHVSHLNNYWDMGTGSKNPEDIPVEILDKKIHGNELLEYLYTRKILYGGGSTYAARSKAIKGKLNFKSEMGTVVDEYITVATIGLNYSYFISQPLTLYRLHGNNVSKISNEFGDVEFSKLSVRVNCTKVIEQQLLQDGILNNKAKNLYILKSKEYALYFKKITHKDSLLEIINLYLFVISNISLFGKNFFIIIARYKLLKYFIPSSLFLLIKRSIVK